MNIRTPIYTAAMTAAMALTGCMVGPDYEAPQAKLPGQFGEAERMAAAPATQPTTRPTSEQMNVVAWWEQFNDPVLTSLVGRAVESNYNLQVASARLAEARANVGVIAPDLWPTLNASGAYSRTRRSENGGGGSGRASGGTGGSSSGGGGSSIQIPSTDRESDAYQAGFDASWELDVFGGTRRAIEAARAQLEAAEWGRRDALVTLLGDVARNYVTARGLQRRIRINENNLRSQRDSVELTRSRFRAGLTSDLDVAQAEAQAATTAAIIPALQTQLRQTIHAISILLGEEPNAVARQILDTPQQHVTGATTAVPVGLPSDLLRRRPDVRAAERQLAAANANIGVAVADLFPRFSLTGALGWQSSATKNLFSVNSLFWNVGPSVNWTLLDFGRIRANIAVQDARQQAALAQYQQTVLDTLKEVEDALVAFDQEQVRRQRLAEAVAAQQRAVDLSEQLYARGLGDFLSVLVAQRALNTAQDDLVQSETAVTTNLVALYKALGGGWEAYERNGGKPPQQQPAPTNEAGERRAPVALSQ